MRKTSLFAALGLAGTMTLAGCQTTEPLTIQQKVAGCGAMIGGGALLGAIAGNNLGDGNAGQGMALGAALGGASCAIWLAFENEKDKRRLVEAQLVAASQGQTYTDSWTGDDGKARSVTVVPSNETSMVPASAQASTSTPMICRRLNTTATFDGRSEQMQEVSCRDADGNWSKMDQRMVDAPGSI